MSIVKETIQMEKDHRDNFFSTLLVAVNTGYSWYILNNMIYEICSIWYVEICASVFYLLRLSLKFYVFYKEKFVKNTRKW